MSKVIDLTGQTFGKLKVIARSANNNRGESMWECQCECGNTKVIRGYTLNHGLSKSCGCERYRKLSEANFQDLTGQIFNKLTVLEYVGADKSRKTLWKCQCDCDAHTIIITRGADLRSGKTTSCGCVKSRGEEKIATLLSNNNIPFEKEKIFSDCIYPDTGAYARYDFYVDNKYLIEYDGIQHFDKTSPWYGKNLEHDNFKNDWCVQHNIKLIRINYQQIDKLTLEDLIYNE